MSDRIRVYRRNPVENTQGYSVDRPWMVADAPEDYGRKTCYPTWGEAMAWATLPSDERKRQIEEELKMEGGW